MQIEVKNLSFVYGKKSPFEKKALDNVSFVINEGESVGIIGSTGSGKSTLVQHLNGLIKLQEGGVKVLDIDLSVKKPNYKLLRKGVGMLFQYPEYQLFADTVLADVMFGPVNFGMTKADAETAAREALTMVGLQFDEVRDRSPLELSGGQKRRVAIAGVLACRPEILILDEPTAGLDPTGKRDTLDLVASLRKGFVKTVLTVSHNMDEIAEYTDRVLVMHNAQLLHDTTPADLFYHYDVTNYGLSTPHVVKIVQALQKKGISLPPVLREKDLVQQLFNLGLKGANT